MSGENQQLETVIRDGVEGVIIGNDVFVPNDPVVKGALKPVPEMTPMEALAGVAAAIVTGLALWSMIVTDTTIVIVAGVLASVTACYGYIQQTNITDIKTLGETQDKIEKAVIELQHENNKLGQNISAMEVAMTKLQDVEKTYKLVVNMEDSAIDNLEEQIKQSKEILAMNKQSLKQKIIDNLITSVSDIDKDHDNNISSSEVDDMLNIISNISGVSVKEEKLREAIENKPKGNLMKVIIDISKYEDRKDSQNIFILDEDLFQEKQSIRQSISQSVRK